MESLRESQGGIVSLFIENSPLTAKDSHLKGFSTKSCEHSTRKSYGECNIQALNLKLPIIVHRARG